MKKHTVRNRIIAAAVMAAAAFAAALILLPAPEKQKERTDVPAQTSAREDSSAEQNGGGDAALTYEDGIRSIERFGVLSQSGYQTTDAVYDPATCKMAIVRTGVGLPDVFSYGEGQKRTVTREPDGNGGYVYKESYAAAEEPAIRVYGGYLLISDGEKTALVTPEADRVLLEDTTGYAPAYQRDTYGRPLFIKDGKYYYYNQPTSDSIKQAVEVYVTSDGTELTLPPEEFSKTEGFAESNADTAYFLPISYDYSFRSYLNTGGIYRYHKHNVKLSISNIDEIYQNRLDIAIENYKLSKGEPPEKFTEEIAPVVTERDAGYSWQYIDGDCNLLFSKSGRIVGDFSPDGRAVVVNGSNRVTVIDDKGKTVIDPYNELVTLQEAENPLHDLYMLPDTYGIESLGMFKYDNGALRIRRRLVDTGNNGYVKSETQILISTDGSILSYPRSFTLVGYSDGLMLLEKDGEYGYMDIYGNWVVNPSYTYAEPFSEGLAVVGYKNSTYGVIDTKGNTVLPKIYKYVSTCSSGTVAAYSDKGGWTVYRKMTDVQLAEPVDPVNLRARIDAALLEKEKQDLIEETLRDAEKQAIAEVEKLKAEDAAAVPPAAGEPAVGAVTPISFN